MNKSSDDWNKLKHLVDLSAENARLKAEVERLTNCKSEADRLKAEVERLRNLGIKLDGYVDLLQAENERLRKAGDALFGIAYNAGPGEGRVEKLDAWRAAKEGNQP